MGSLRRIVREKGHSSSNNVGKKINELKLQEEDTLDEFITKFEDLVNQLKKCGAVIPERNLVTKLMLALPPSFDVIVTLIENMPIEELTIENIKVKLRHEMEKRKGKAERDCVNTNEEEKPTTFLSRNMGTCYSCGRRGHIARNCRSRVFQNYRNPTGNSNPPARRRGTYQWNRGFRGRGRGYRRPTTNSYNQQGRSSQDNNNDHGQGNYVENYDKRVCFMHKVRTDYNKIEEIEKLKFYIDSGCTDHLVNNNKVFSEIIMLKEPIKIKIAKSNEHLEAVAVGNI